jgi:hypothetical protein
VNRSSTKRADKSVAHTYPAPFEEFRMANPIDNSFSRVLQVVVLFLMVGGLLWITWTAIGVRGRFL